MKKRLPLVLAILALFVASAQASELGLDALDDATIRTLNTPVTIGWQFRLDRALTVDGLGVFDVGSDGFADAHDIGLWNSAGVLLATGSVQAGTASPLVAAATTTGDWRIESIAPVNLGPGSYVIGAYYPTGADQALWSAAPWSTYPGVVYANARDQAVGDGALSFPNISFDLDGGVFGPTFTVTPEPGTVVLLGVGIAGLALVRRRRTTVRA